MKRTVSEADVAAVVIGWLEARGYDVYQEVELTNGGIRADIVAKRGPELTIIETKTSASLALLYQAMERRRFAHRVYVAVPVTAHAMIDICKDLGIGVVRVYVGTGEKWDVSRCDEEVSSRRWNTRPLKLAIKLRPEHKTSAAAGFPTGGHWSRWRETCAQLERIVAREPGILLKAAMRQTSHHYSSGHVAVSSMLAHILKGRVAGVYMRDGALWPSTKAMP